MMEVHKGGAIERSWLMTAKTTQPRRHEVNDVALGFAEWLKMAGQTDSPTRTRKRKTFAPEKWWLEDELPFEKRTNFRDYLKFPGSNYPSVQPTATTPENKPFVQKERRLVSLCHHVFRGEHVGFGEGNSKRCEHTINAENVETAESQFSNLAIYFFLLYAVDKTG